MIVPPNIPDDCVERLMDVLFRAVPAMDADEVIGLFNSILRIVSAGIRAAIRHELRRRRLERNLRTYELN